jgi:hypothetical protein
MIINGLSIEPSMVTGVINLVLAGWIILAVLDYLLKRFDLLEDLLLATLFILVGLRFALLGIQEQNPMKALLCVPFIFGALKLLRTKMGRWRAAA